MTLEELQAKVLELTDKVNDLSTERDKLSQDNEDLKKRNDELGTINQSYFNRLIAEERNSDEDTKDETDESDNVLTCEEFAKSMIEKNIF